MKSVKQLFNHISFIVILLLNVSMVQAAPGFDSISFKPSASQAPYFSIEGSRTLKQWGHAAGLWAEFSNDSVIARTAQDVRIRDITNEQIVTHVNGSVGLLDWLDVGARVTFVPYHKFETPLSGTSDNGAHMGDIGINAKARILDAEKAPIGLAIVPFVNIPTGNEEHFVGNGKVAGGGLLVLESPKLMDRLQLALNVGGDIRDQANLSFNTAIDDRFLFGAGANMAITKKVDAIAELTGWTPFQDFFENNLRNLEANAGVRIKPTGDLLVALGGGTGILDAIGAPDFRVFASIGYRHEAEETPEEEVIRTNKVHFEFDKAKILPESYAVLDDIAVQIKQHQKVQHVEVEGHSDSQGTDEYNQRLSERRAQAVRQYLIQKGIAADRVSAVGKGESEPIASNETAEGRALNRRVEFHLQLSSKKNIRVVEKDNAPTFLEKEN